MNHHQPFQTSGSKSGPDAPPTRRLSAAAAAILLTSMVLTLRAGAGAQELRFSSGNDFLTNNPTNDDHYTSAIEIALQRGPYTIALRENAFTDRDADLRFDETYLTVERTFQAFEPWLVTAEAGIAHVGRGFFGQELQNAIHRVLGNEEVDFEYLADSRLRPIFAATAERPFRVRPRLTVGPRLEAFAVPDLRAHAVAAIATTWGPIALLDLHVVAGLRASDASLAALEPHTAQIAHVLRVGLVLWDRVTLAWTFNDYGDRREHVTLGYRFGLGSGDEHRD